jgi:hypothetical protein
MGAWPEPEDWILYLPLATDWLLTAGQTIYAHCVEDDTDDGWDRGTWNTQKWEYWKMQLAAFAKRDDFNEECRDLAAQTVRKMAEVEAEYKPPGPNEGWADG